MLSDENFDILFEGIQEKARIEGKDIANPNELLRILKDHWDELTDFASAATANKAAELARLQTQQPAQETELQKTKDRIRELEA